MSFEWLNCLISTVIKAGYQVPLTKLLVCCSYVMLRQYSMALESCFKVTNVFVSTGAYTYKRFV